MSATPVVVVFIPAHDEEATVGGVVRRAPAEVLGHPVRRGGRRRLDRRHRRSRRAAGARVQSSAPTGAGRRGAHAGWPWASAGAPRRCSSTPTASTPRGARPLVAPILDGRADYVVGSRFAGEATRAMRPHRWLGNRVLTRARCSCGAGACGPHRRQSGYRALSAVPQRPAEVIHDFNYAQVLTLDLVAKGFRYAEVPDHLPLPPARPSFVRLGPYLRRGGARGRRRAAL